jgi:hypothetical protein
MKTSQAGSKGTTVAQGSLIIDESDRRAHGNNPEVRGDPHARLITGSNAPSRKIGVAGDHQIITIFINLCVPAARARGLIGLPDTTIRAARTLRRRLLQVAGSPDPPRPILHASPTRPLALARGLHQSASHRHLSAVRRVHQDQRDLRRPGAITAARQTPNAARPSCPNPTSQRTKPSLIPSRPVATSGRIKQDERPFRWIQAQLRV